MLFVVDFCCKFCKLPPCWLLIFSHTLYSALSWTHL